MSTPPTQQRDKIIAWKLHYALFHCLTEYYVGWPASKEGWTVKFSAFAETKFTREESWCLSCPHSASVRWGQAEAAHYNSMKSSNMFPCLTQSKLCYPCLNSVLAGIRRRHCTAQHIKIKARSAAQMHEATCQFLLPRQ